LCSGGKFTAPSFGWPPLDGASRLFEWSPFEIFVIASTRDLSIFAFLTSRLYLVTFEALRFAGDTAYMSLVSLSSTLKYGNVEQERRITVPLRLFDCFFFVTSPLSDAFASPLSLACRERMLFAKGWSAALVCGESNGVLVM
jgi:hypothetical protein